MGDGDPDMHMYTDELKTFGDKLDDVATQWAAWPQKRSRLDALDSALGQQDSIAAAYYPGYQKATGDIFELAEEVLRTSAQAASVALFAAGDYDRANELAELGMRYGG
jgi:hypothetical protein